LVMLNSSFFFISVSWPLPHPFFPFHPRTKLAQLDTPSGKYLPGELRGRSFIPEALCFQSARASNVTQYSAMPIASMDTLLKGSRIPCWMKSECTLMDTKIAPLENKTSAKPKTLGILQ
jgi:hypothetical protein